MLLLTTAHVAALRCYVSIDSPCEVYKGYKGGCVQDIGVVVECPGEFSKACKTTFRFCPAPAARPMVGEGDAPPPESSARPLYSFHPTT